MKVVSSSEMKEIDKKAIEGLGIPSLVLMENAGRKVAEAIARFFPGVDRITIFCGPGNNGGDGLVCARHLHFEGKKVKVYLTEREKLSPDAKHNLGILEKLKFPVSILKSVDEGILKDTELVVDALLGTGLKGEARGKIREIIELINSSSLPVVSVDTPSGLGEGITPNLKNTVKADVTVTMGLPKKEQVVFPGAEFVGKLLVARIGFPPSFLNSSTIKVNLLEEEYIKNLLIPRKPDTHKGTYGHVFILAGSVGFTGAPYLATLGALYSGAGLVSLGLPSSIYSIVSSRLGEAMPKPLPETDVGSLSLKAFPQIKEFSQRITCLAIGPGISLHQETGKLVLKIAEEIDKPMIIDADALTHLKENLSLLKKRKSPTILTPHPGEMARLSGKDKEIVAKERIGIAQEMATTFGVYLVLKGARSVISTPEGEVYINPTGNPGMASGGMGDVLTGMIAGYLAQGYSPKDSLLLGVFLHGLAGDYLRRRRGERGLLASEVAQILPEVVEKLVRESIDLEYFFAII